MLHQWWVGASLWWVLSRASLRPPAGRTRVTWPLSLSLSLCFRWSTTDRFCPQEKSAMTLSARRWGLEKWRFSAIKPLPATRLCFSRRYRNYVFLTWYCSSGFGELGLFMHVVSFVTSFSVKPSLDWTLITKVWTHYSGFSSRSSHITWVFSLS